MLLFGWPSIQFPAVPEPQSAPSKFSNGLRPFLKVAEVGIDKVRRLSRRRSEGEEAESRKIFRESLVS